MKFDWVNLEEGEEVLWKGQPRIKSIIPAVIIGLPLSIFGIGILIIVGAYLNVKNTSFVVTDEALYRKTGVFSRSVQKIGFDKVQNISFSQGIFGNYFNYGNVEFSTAGGSGVEMRFNSIDNPRKVEKIINQQLQEVGSGREKKGSNSVEEELVKIRKVLEDINSKL